MHWKVKGITQRILSAVPGGVWVNDLLQRTVGGLRNFDAQVDSKVEDWSILASHMRELGVPLGGLHYLEVGTGWFPTLPVCYALAGAGRVTTFDLTRHLDGRLTSRMLDRLEKYLPTIATTGGRSVADVEAEYGQLRAAAGIDALLRQAGVEYHAPADATATGLPPDAVDVVFSNSVLEHVTPDVIGRLFTEAHRVLRPGGLMIHSLNCGDHYAYFDNRISFINYLTYTEREWRRWDNKLLYQNRLRPRDFVERSERTGFEIVLRKQKPRPVLLELLPTLAIAPEFRAYPPEELCATSIDFVSRKPG
jgi:SAM-dependent methyltransferase